MTKTLTIHIDTDGMGSVGIKHKTIADYNEIIYLLKKKKDIELENTYIPNKHIAKVWYEEEE